MVFFAEIENIPEFLWNLKKHGIAKEIMRKNKVGGVWVGNAGHLTSGPSPLWCHPPPQVLLEALWFSLVPKGLHPNKGDTLIERLAMTNMSKPMCPLSDSHMSLHHFSHRRKPPRSRDCPECWGWVQAIGGQGLLFCFPLPAWYTCFSRGSFFSWKSQMSSISVGSYIRYFGWCSGLWKHYLDSSSSLSITLTTS